MNWQKIVIIAFVLSIVFVYAPLITLIAGAIILAIYGRDEIKNLIGRRVIFTEVLFLSFFIAISVQSVLAIIFGASFDELVQTGGLLMVLKNPDALRIGVIKEIFALVIVFSSTYLMVTSVKPNRWVFKLAIVFSLLALTFQCWNGSLSEEQQTRHARQWSLLRDAVVANIDSRVNDIGLSFKHDTVINKQPACYYASAGAYLYSQEGDSVKRGESVKIDSKWFHLTVSENIVDKATGISYAPVASYDDETKTGWMRVDQLDKSPVALKSAPLSPVAVKEVALPVIQKKSPIVNKQDILDDVPMESVTQLKAPVLEPEKNRNVVTVTSGDWISSEVAPYEDVIVEIGMFSLMEDVKRIEARINGGTIPSLTPRKCNNGFWCARLNFNSGGDNKDRHPIELRLKYGLPLSVTVQKIDAQ